MADCSTELCPQGYRQVTLDENVIAAVVLLTDKVDYFTEAIKYATKDTEGNTSVTLCGSLFCWTFISLLKDRLLNAQAAI